MKKIVVEELHIFSLQEKKAKKVNLSDGVNIILGPNRTGKSSLARNIFAGLGASVAHPNQWTNLNTATFIKFKIDSTKYSIVRFGKFFKIFDCENKLLGKFSSVTEELAPFLSNIFNFKLILTNQQFASKQALPAFLFLPFYIDQEESWKKPLSSFTNLQQFKKWNQDLLSYHVGIKPNEYYEKKSELIIEENKVNKIHEELKIIKNIKNRQIEKHHALDFSLDPKQYVVEIENLLKEIQPIRDLEHEIKNKLKNLFEKKNTLLHQQDCATHVLNEVKNDFNFASNEESTIECPTCGTIHDNFFESQLEIAEDENRVESLISQIKSEIIDIEKEIHVLEDTEATLLDQIERVTQILETKKEELTLQQIIENEGVKNSLQSIKEEESEILLKNNQLNIEIEEIKKKIALYTDKKLAKAVNKYFHEKMISNLQKVEVLNLNPKTYKNIKCKISTDGSDLPRAILAYYFSLWETMLYHNKSQLTLPPIIIDSPNQGGQDDIRLPLIYDFIFKNIPQEGQFILTAESIPNHDLSNYNVIQLDSQYNLLNPEDYQEDEKFYLQLVS